MGLVLWLLLPFLLELALYEESSWAAGNSYKGKSVETAKREYIAELDKQKTEFFSTVSNVSLAAIRATQLLSSYKASSSKNGKSNQRTKPKSLTKNANGKHVAS